MLTIWCILQTILILNILFSNSGAWGWKNTLKVSCLSSVISPTRLKSTYLTYTVVVAKIKQIVVKWGWQDGLGISIYWLC